MSWRDPPPLPTWRDFLRRAWDAMFNIEKMAEAIEKSETATVLERIEGHLVVLSEHAESATLARRQGLVAKRRDSLERSRALAEADQACCLRVIQESSGFDERLPVQALPPGGEGCHDVITQAIPNDQGQTATIFSLLGPPTAHITEIRFSAGVAAFRGNARVVELDLRNSRQGEGPAFAAVSIYQRSPTGES